MSRKVPQQSLPHYGVKNGFTRKGANVTGPDVKTFDEDGGSATKPGETEHFKSISRAKRFMRTGSEKRK